MPNPTTTELQQSLARVQAALASAPQLDAASRQALRDTLQEIEAALTAGGDSGAAAAERPLAQRAAPGQLEALTVRFEADHPALAASAREFIDLLGRAGL